MPVLIRLTCGPCAESKEQALGVLVNLASHACCAGHIVAASGASALVQLAKAADSPASQQGALTLTMAASHV